MVGFVFPLRGEKIVEGGTDVDIQAAIDGLTAGRTWKEKVVLLGDFTIATTIAVPSYTILEIQGRLKADSVVTGTGIIDNADSTNTDIEIIGGTCDMDTINPVGGDGSTIHMGGVDNLIIEDCFCTNARQHNISLVSCTDFQIIKNHCDIAGDDGISVVDCQYGIVSENICKGGTGVVGGSAGIEIEDNSHHIIVIGNYCEDNDSNGIQVIKDTATKGIAPNNITISGNVTRANGGKGINVTSSGSVTNTSIVESGSGPWTYTVTTSSNHLFPTTGILKVLISGSDVDGHNGVWVITRTGVATYTFTSLLQLGNPSSAHGTTNFYVYDISVTGNDCSDNTSDNFQIKSIISGIFSGNISSGSGAAGMLIQNAYNSTMTGNAISFATTDGLNLGNEAFGVGVTNNSIGQCGSDGINISSTGTNLSIVGNVIQNCARTIENKYGIRLGGTNTNAVIANNSIQEDRPTTQMRGIIESGGTNAQIFGNILDTDKNAGHMITVSGTTPNVHHNFNYVTENTGTGSITSGGTTDVISHGIASTHTITAANIHITLTENPTNTPGAIWVDTITSSAFTVNCENDPGASNLDFSWQVTGP